MKDCYCTYCDVVRLRGELSSLRKQLMIAKMKAHRNAKFYSIAILESLLRQRDQQIAELQEARHARNAAMAEIEKKTKGGE